MTRTIIGLILAAAIILVGYNLLTDYLSDYLIDDGDGLPSLDAERFLYDSASGYVQYLYDGMEETSAQETEEAVPASETEQTSDAAQVADAA